MEQITQVVGWIGLVVTAFSGAVAGIRALIRGPKEDKALEVDLQDKVTALAERWLTMAEQRLKDAEAKAQSAEDRAAEAEAEIGKLRPRVEQLEYNLLQALNTIGDLWSWGLEGGKGPRPVLPAWIFEWLHKQSKGA